MTRRRVLLAKTDLTKKIVEGCPIHFADLRGGPTPSTCINCAFFSGFEYSGDGPIHSIRCEKE